jgi:hypothetical protein
VFTVDARGRELGRGTTSLRARWLPELLETLGDFGTASLELVAWELSLSEDDLADAKRQAISNGMIEIAGRDPASDEETYRLTRAARLRN